MEFALRPENFQILTERKSMDVKLKLAQDVSKKQVRQSEQLNMLNTLFWIN
jgi:hypothetical protein